MTKLMLAAVAATLLCLGARAASTHDKVQLWEGGPYWATTNIGAENPEDYGYYFWWGDTVGYTNTGSAWISVKDGTEISFESSSPAGATYNKNNSALQSAGYIDSAGNLVAAYDAATAHLGSPWRMPTRDEIDALISNCTTTWITTNGVNGRLVTGKDDYADRSIFLPAAGYGTGHGSDSSNGSYWSSTPDSSDSPDAFDLYVTPSAFRVGYGGRRFYGQSVRPVWQPVTVDLSTLTANYTARDGDVLTGSTAYGVIIPGGATVTINGVAVAGAGGGAANPPPVFASGGKAATTEFVQGEGGKWTLTTFAELSNDALGADVAAEQIKVYAADTVEGLESASPMASGVEVKEKKSAVKTTLEVTPPSGSQSQFFKVKFGE